MKNLKTIIKVLALLLFVPYPHLSAVLLVFLLEWKEKEEGVLVKRMKFYEDAIWAFCKSRRCSQ